MHNDKRIMCGGIFGDIIGVPYEFKKNWKSKDFPLITEESKVSDDSIMTIAVANALVFTISQHIIDDKLAEKVFKTSLITSMVYWGNLYPDVGYGGYFKHWLFSDDNKEPYNSYGNGSAMRVSSVGWVFDTLEETRKYARWSAEVTHNHPEGIKGAECVASIIFLARNNVSLLDIKHFVEKEFNYKIFLPQDVRRTYSYDVSCEGTVAPAISCFLFGKDYEDTIRNAISLGGDADTLACIAGSMAEAYYGIPQNIKDICYKKVPKRLFSIIDMVNDIYYKGDFQLNA